MIMIRDSPTSFGREADRQYFPRQNRPTMLLKRPLPKGTNGKKYSLLIEEFYEKVLLFSININFSK